MVWRDHEPITVLAASSSGVSMTLAPSCGVPILDMEIGIGKMIVVVNGILKYSNIHWYLSFLQLHMASKDIMVMNDQTVS